MKHPIKLYISDETNFKHNKWVLTEVLSCYITENVDGQLQLDLEYPLFDSKCLAKYLIRGYILKAPIYDNRPDQLFKIRKATKNTEGTKVVVYAEAIARADADNNYIPGLEIPAGKIRKEAMKIVLNNRADKRRTYSIGNLDTSTNTNVNLGLNDDTGEVINYVDIADKSLLKAILEESTDKTNSSIYTAYKGEVIWNNFEINMVDERGKDNSFIIKSGKNLESLEEDIDDTDEDFATALIMKSSDGLFLPNQEVIYSPNANKYDRYFFKTITCDDVSFEDLVTEDSTESDIEKAKQIVYEQLRERAQKLFNEGIDKPPTNYTINFIQLADSEEYKEFAKLEKCELGNNVTAIYSKIGVKKEGRVLSIKYNVLTDKIEEVEIGDRLKQDITTTINNTENTVKNNKDELKEDIKKTSEKEKEARNNLKVVMEKRDSEIELSVTNEAAKRQAAIEVCEEAINQRVTEKDFGTYKTQTAKDISQKVDSGDGFTTELKQNVDAFQFLFEEASGSKTEITRDGITVYKGGFKIKDSNGNTIFWIDSNGILRAKYLWADDLKLDGDSAETGSSLWNVLYAMDSITLTGELKVRDRFTIKASDFYINDGYNLTEYIEKIVNNM
ncbi:phage tail protein [Clostridium butyricum]|uniref:Phage minor structural protein n=1 Tax=Clostridium butyricum E4 str. BoNT E BL5262 TaxID=632245 RepID=C4IFF6_CLOBU|nr:phage tail protein [Clostridium butyricum]EDT75157.1 phage minor structural protein, N- region [Clostridium butyricum 5521]EEP55062.1 phage minor structural protein [Clostridium butyricum E4 str. BoNT E BL5262]NFL32857.1 hypothetical protein [Clostridium butyricum]NFS20231.1 hypothetical protein [Clostridium butyricum]